MVLVGRSGDWASRQMAVSKVLLAAYLRGQLEQCQGVDAFSCSFIPIL